MRSVLHLDELRKLDVAIEVGAAAAQVFVTAVNGAQSAFARYKIMRIFRFYYIAATLALHGVFCYFSHCMSSFHSLFTVP